MTEIRFHHLEQRRIDQALPPLLERALEEGRRVLVRAPSDEMVAALNGLLWTYADASFLPHGAAGDGDPMTQPIFLTSELENPNAATMLVRLSGAEAERGGRRVRSRRSHVRRTRRGGACPRAGRMAAAQGSGPHDQLLARERRGRLGAGAVSLGCLGAWPFRSEFPCFSVLDFLGFPWILSSESRLINGLHGIFAEKFFSAVLSPNVCSRGDASGRF